METIYEARWLLLFGALQTIQLFLVSTVLAVVVAIVSGLAKLAPSLLLRSVSTVYAEIFRGTSLVVQLFWLYYALPFLGLSLETFTAAALGVGLCFGAYGSEIVRGAINSVPRSQIEAAIALNMSRYDRMRRIIFPQAFVAMLPPFGNLLILLLKSTSAASLIAFPELTFQASKINYQAQATFEVFTVILIIYFILAQIVAVGIQALERRVGAWRLR